VRSSPVGAAKEEELAVGAGVEAVGLLQAVTIKLNNITNEITMCFFIS
jgi:hypothetical protein